VSSRCRSQPLSSIHVCSKVLSSTTPYQLLKGPLPSTRVGHRAAGILDRVELPPLAACLGCHPAHIGGTAHLRPAVCPLSVVGVPASQNAASVVRPSVVPAVRIVAAISVVAVGLSVAACGDGDRPRVSGTGSTTTTASTTAAEVATTLPPQAGYRGVKSFCASAPLSGHVLYDGAAKQLVPSVLTVAIGGLPPDSAVYVDWSNDHIRGYIIASFSTDSAGTPIPSSVSMGRLPEVRGVEMVLESVTIPPTVFGRLQPC
jgi:hypothetical protein